MKRYRLVRGALLALLAIPSTVNAGTSPTIDEYQLKAAVLYNFAKFVEWPPETFQGPADPITLCILGENPFGNGLDQTIRGKSIGDRKITIRQISDGRQVTGCQIVFVGSAERKRLRALLAEGRSSGVLIVGDSENFALTEGW